MYLISAGGYENTKVDFLRVREIDKFWVNMKKVLDDLGVKKHVLFSFKRNIWNLWNKKPYR